MEKQVILCLILINAAIAFGLSLQEEQQEEYLLPTVLVTLLVRNKAHVLPMFLSYLAQLDYPKDRIAIWVRCDHSSDNSIEILQEWLEHTADFYHSVNYALDNDETKGQSHHNETSPYDWPVSRFKHVIALKEEAFEYARDIWADFVFFLDSDVMLTEKQTLKSLIGLRLPIVAPMLLSEGLYSNFWCGMTEDYYYQRTDEYKEIYQVKKLGVFQVPMIHTAVMVDMNYKRTRNLTFDRVRLQEMQKNRGQSPIYEGPADDIIVFAISANSSGIPLHVSNELAFGYVLQPLEPSDTLEQDLLQIINIRANMVNDLGAVPPLLDYFQESVQLPEKSKLTLDHIYMINLDRRPERRQKMENLFDELGLNVEHFSAVDGKQLNSERLQEMGIQFLSGYEDPYHHRAMTMGEIGCFLSHYNIWKQMLELNQKEVLILEDDIRFEPYFTGNALRVINQARNAVEYDLIYFGRKRLKEETEPWVEGADSLVHVGYSYWTLGYVISLEGARKLLAANPLKKLIPVDEFLPLMFDRHPNKTWSSAFEERNLIALSAAPLLLYPIHYTGETGYISDTEDSQQINVESATTTCDSEPRLKSDREHIFISQDDNHVLDQLSSMVIAKSHQEL
ncbi:uncharacterized protein Dwil_GK27803 [Drosophila willistoni]|uniref:Glycosyl transferase family 25 domain-containing protein n=1 Tax=Drosophila willistoni TaxID=7260 RepID=A0A0Q9WQB2_DROWI|nr:glycosyltransferase 25 family member [Drosophila willistoni]KRF98362.1 uncharacterized protein Dwil_GK27803 [Drosophila willistoni]